jgi:hypothetical protein
MSRTTTSYFAADITCFTHITRLNGRGFLEAHFALRLEAAEVNRYKVAKVDYQAWIDHFTKA